MSIPRSMFMIEKIRNILKKSNSHGIWINELARKVGVSDSTIQYYLDGKVQKGVEYGGYLKNEIETVKIQGKNRMVRIA